ncbi:MAG: hemolysin III family protein [Spirochaetia bacterium]|nr:hemolysin III family protein [Spirochaetia bacterium]
MYKGERFNSITHLIGVLLSVAALAVLVVYASLLGDVWKIVSFSIYGVTLVSLYLFSTLYHSFSGRAKIFFRKMDFVAIYILIAGTYTPLTLVVLRGSLWGWTLFGINWGLALIGIIIEIMGSAGRLRILPILIYIGMGWLILLAIKPLMEVLPLGGFLLLLAGGLLYTGGIFFYAFDEKIKHGHGIWHLFVLAGSVAHFLAILMYVL